MFKATDLPIYSIKAGYSPQWADRLYRGIKRNTTAEINFVCLVDQDYTFEEKGIKAVRFQEKHQGWSWVMESMRPDLGECKQRVVVGLDTLITGSLDEILSFDGELGLLTDPIFPHTICNGVGIYARDLCLKIWEDWQSRRKELLRECIFGGHFSEMVYLRKYYGDCARLDQIYKDQIQSYKIHYTQSRTRQEKARIVYFHGQPKMQQIPDVELLRCWI